MRIATWNVNSIRQRLENLCAWLQERQPDVVCLQETKTTDDAFPRGPLEDLGYNLAIHGQKTFNGVAILSKYPFDDGDHRAARRCIRRPCAFHRGRGCRNRRASCAWPASICRTAIRSRARNIPTSCAGWTGFATMRSERLRLEEPLVLAGDYNVIPAPEDVHNPAAWAEDALFRPTDPREIPRARHISG